MAKGVEQFNFEFLLCDVIPIDCYTTFRFGVVESATPQFQGKILNFTNLMFDEDSDFIKFEDWLLELAQELYDTQDEVVFVPE